MAKINFGSRTIGGSGSVPPQRRREGERGREKERKRERERERECVDKWLQRVCVSVFRCIFRLVYMCLCVSKLKRGEECEIGKRRGGNLGGSSCIKTDPKVVLTSNACLWQLFEANSKHLPDNYYNTLSLTMELSWKGWRNHTQIFFKLPLAFGSTLLIS